MRTAVVDPGGRLHSPALEVYGEPSLHLPRLPAVHEVHRPTGAMAADLRAPAGVLTEESAECSVKAATQPHGKVITLAVSVAQKSELAD